jgi:hypothetical protein
MEERPLRHGLLELADAANLMGYGSAFDYVPDEGELTDSNSAGAERPDTIDHSDGRTTFLGAGESYRPAAHARSPPRRVSPQRIDTFRSRDRSPPRRARSPVGDSYHPGTSIDINSIAYANP